jgi:phosphocarrier protein HPr
VGATVHNLAAELRRLVRWRAFRWGGFVERVELELTIINALGLHARAAAKLVTIANRFAGEVEVECEGQAVNGKSIMGVLMLAAAQGMQVKVRCSGPGAQACADEIAALIASKFGEPR